MMLFLFALRVVESEESQSMIRQWQELVSQLSKDKKCLLKSWETVAEKDLTEALNQPMVKRMPDSTIQVNFSQDVRGLTVFYTMASCCSHTWLC